MSFERDPVCGMSVDTSSRPPVDIGGRSLYFCSAYCEQLFARTPESYLRVIREGRSGVEARARRIAYFSMEVAVDPRLPTYAGGLGVLAGDTLRALADLNVPAVGVSLLYRRGYFRQTIDAAGNQLEQPVDWAPESLLDLEPGWIEIALAGRPLRLRAWRYEVRGLGDHRVPLLLLDADFEPNLPEQRRLTHHLYGGDERERLCQESILGAGGLRMLRELGFDGIERYHLNEGHASLLALELLREEPSARSLGDALESVRRRCVFTTHTPVPAGHDRFPYELVRAILGEPLPASELRMLGGEDRLNLTLLALNTSGFVNGVAKRHGEVSRSMFPGYPIGSVTNGVHSFAWTAEPFRRLYDRHIPGWKTDPASLRYALHLPAEEVWNAHVESKRELLDEVQRRTGRKLDPAAFTLGFARRATGYKRTDLVVRDPGRLADIGSRCGALQMLFSGKAHPRDAGGKEMIRRVVGAARDLGDEIPTAYLEDYDLELARLLTAGVDLWLNTPAPPLEASGTSGMKAAHNGVPSLSTLDGWWLEGHLEGVTGWSLGARPNQALDRDADREVLEELLSKLERVILPLFYGDRPAWIEMMKRTIALNASFFNAHRMVMEYAARAYV